ncbi:MAG: type I secretion system permease/ATPase [Rhodobacterales bacterium]|nr:MAG: type I secretion system permease/ATPase [Rhodobacterales bacterium]
MSPDQKDKGAAELRSIRRESNGLLWAVALFSVFTNLLMLTGPLYMLQIYDRVLGSRSEETLLGLTVLMGFLFAMMGVLDYARGRVLARVGARFQARLDRRVFRAVLRREALRPAGEEGNRSGLRDLEAVQKLISSPVFMALFDLPWTPIFLAAILLFHPWLGYLALAGGALLVLVSWLNQATTSGPTAAVNLAAAQAEHMAGQLRSEAEMVAALGMSDNAYARWLTARRTALSEGVRVADRAGRFSAISKTFRMFLQSAMLGLGALLVLRGEMTAGGMIAASILLGRALAPVDMLIAQWPLVHAGSTGRKRLIDLLGTIAPEPDKTQLPRPRGLLTAENLTIVPPGQAQASLRMVNFRVEPGQAMGVIGPSGAGKSTLARAATGVWRPAGGKLRLDGAALSQFSEAALGQYVGYLPQRVQLFDGTVAENIAGLAPTPDDAAVVAAAKRAAAHEMILALPEGYDTQVSAGGGMLSGGQMQRIGLARALYGDPVLLVLDEPNSNLDNEGSLALNRAVAEVKANGGAVLIMAHRPSAIAQCELLLMLDGGAVQAYGPRDKVLAQVTQNAQQIRESAAENNTGGVT